MTHSAIAKSIQKNLPTVSKALAALVAMERELGASKSYEAIQHVIREAAAIKVLYGYVDAVKAGAEDTILIANRRIAEEIRKVPKATHKGGPKKQITAHGKSVGRGATGIPGTSRARLQKLADIPVPELKAVSAELRAAGKDATVNAVVRQITQGDKKTRRKVRERELGAKQLALPTKQYGVIVCDDEWDHEVYSRETGMDRHASNHYPTAENAHTAEELHERTKARFECAAADCLLAMWSTVQHLDVAVDLLRLRGFKYKSHYVWGKNKIGLGYWNRNKHDILLIGTKGNVPCPAPGEQLDSLIIAPVSEHSAKPECFLEMLETYFPTLPKIEFNRRGAPRPGWDAWGNEVDVGRVTAPCFNGEA